LLWMQWKPYRMRNANNDKDRIVYVVVIEASNYGSPKGVGTIL
jgi:hypothetical protein